MLRDRSRHSIKTIVLALVLFTIPRVCFGQHGAGGGHVGGASPIGGPLGSGGKATGVAAKDDLRDFHEVLAVQASAEQMAAFAEILRNTAAAAAELKALENQFADSQAPSVLASHNKALEDALESTRILNRKFLVGFSPAQKSGLKIITKRLLKSDSELEQQAKAVDQAVESNAAAPQRSSSAQNLDRALVSFQRAQLDLGDEMSIPTATGAPDLTFNMTPIRNTFKIANQPVTLITSGIISKSDSESGQNTFAVALTEDLSDVQLRFADLLRLKLDKTDGCGERIVIQTAQLDPQGATGLAVVQLHYERWTCVTLFGREDVNEIVEGNGTIEVTLTPQVAEDGTLHLIAHIGRVDAEGLVGDLLRSGSVGEAMRDRIAESILAALSQGGDFKMALPPASRSYASLRSAQFQGAGSGKLMLALKGEIRVSNEQLPALTSELEEASQGQAPQVQTVPGPLLVRPAAPQEPVSR
jgi:hypothetical protein